MPAWLEPFLAAFGLFLVLLDPFFCAALLVTMTPQATPSERSRYALEGVGVALGILVLFAFGGASILRLFSVSLDGFKLGGGLLLLVLGVQTALQVAFRDVGPKNERSPAAMIGSPVLAGPGAITAVLVFTHEHGPLLPLVAATAVQLGAEVGRRPLDRAAVAATRAPARRLRRGDDPDHDRQDRARRSVGADPSATRAVHPPHPSLVPAVASNTGHSRTGSKPNEV